MNLPSLVIRAFHTAPPFWTDFPTEPVLWRIFSRVRIALIPCVPWVNLASAMMLRRGRKTVRLISPSMDATESFRLPKLNWIVATRARECAYSPGFWLRRNLTVCWLGMLRFPADQWAVLLNHLRKWARSLRPGEATPVALRFILPAGNSNRSPMKCRWPVPRSKAQSSSRECLLLTRQRSFSRR